MSQDPSNSVSSEQSSPPPKKRRRLWLKILIGVVVLIVLLIALLPTIASTGMLRSMVVGMVNDQLNGHVEIESWSLGWFSPISVSGVKVFDNQNVLILDVPRVKLGLSLLGAIRSNFALGDDNVVDVASFLVHVDDVGTTNLEKLLKAHGGKPKPAAEAQALPNLSGKFRVNFRGTIESEKTIAGEKVQLPVHVDDSTAIATIVDINQPIQNQVKLAYHVGDSGIKSTIETSGTIHAVKNNVLELTSLAAGQKIDFGSGIDISAIEPFLKQLGADTRLAGILKGGIEIKAEGVSGLSASGQIVLNKLVFAGGPLGQDQFKTEQIAIPVNITRSTVNGDSVIKFENVGVQMAQGTISITGQVTEKSLINLTEKKAPGADGSISIAANITGVADIASQLSHTLKLQQGVQITGGHIDQKFTVALSKDKLTFSQDLKADAQGKRNDQQIVLQPIAVSASAAVLPNGTDLPDVRDLKIGVQSAFATVSGGGDSLAKTEINGKFDLGKLSSEVGQFADMGKTQLQGGGDFKITTSGDLAAANAPIKIDANANLKNVKIISENRQIDQDRLALVASGNLLRDKNMIDKGWASVVGGDPASPLLEIQANANIDLAKGSLPWFETTKCYSSLPLLQQQYGGLAPALAAQKINVSSGVFTASVAGSFGNKTLRFSKPAMLSVSNLTVTRETRPIVSNENINASAFGNVSLNNGITANISDLSVNTDSKMLMVSKSGTGPLTVAMTETAVQGNGALAIAANLKPVMDLVQAFTGAAVGNGANVQSGHLDGSLSFAKAGQPQTDVKFDSKITDLALINGQRPPFKFDGPVALKLAANVRGTDTVEQIEVTELSGDLRVAKLSMPQNIVIKEPLGKAPKYSGQIKLEGQIEQATPLLAVLQGADAMPYSGKYELAQKIGNVGAVNTLEGSIDVNDFKVLADNRRDVIFSEPQIAIRNNVNVDPEGGKVAIKVLTVDMPRSQALAVSITGGVNKWSDRREIRPDTKLDLTYDLEKIWPIVRPMLSAENQASLKDLKIAGKSKQTFALSGAYPAKPTLGESIKFLSADGGFAIDVLDTSGLRVQKFAPQIRMKNGVVTISGQPAIANEGRLDVSGITLDLTKPDPILTIQRNKKLMEKVKLNPVLADGLGKIAAIIFSNATEASGLLNVTVVECDKVPLGALIQKRNDARAELRFSVTELRINGPIPSAVALGIGLGDRGFTGSIPESSAKLADGLVKTDVTVLIGGGADRRGRPVDLPMRFAGGMGVKKLDLRDFDVTIPKALVGANRFPSEIRQLIPDPLVVPLTGTADKPKFDFNPEKLIGSNLGNILGGIGGQEQPRPRQPRSQGR